MKKSLFCDHLISGKGGRYRIEKNQIIHIEKGQIKKIKKAEHPPEEWLSSNPEGIYLKNHLVCPGLINTHSHLSMSLFRGLGGGLNLKKWLSDVILPLEKKYMSPEFVKIGTSLSALELIRFGVTTVFDMYFYSRSSAEVLDRAGLRALLGEGTPQIWKSEIKIFLKEFKNHPRLKPALAPHSPYACDKNLLIQTLEFQKEEDLHLAIHTAERPDEIFEGKSSIHYLHDLGIKGPKTLYVHCVHASDEDLKMMAKSKTPLSHNPHSNMKLSSGIAPISRALDLSVCVGLGTDSQASNNNLDMLEEARSAALISAIKEKRTLLAQEILHSLFLGGARALSMEDQIGSLEAGKKADLIGIDIDQPHWHPQNDLINHLIYSASGLDVRFVMCEGEILMSQGEIQNLDAEKIKYESEKLRKKWI